MHTDLLQFFEERTQDRAVNHDFKSSCGQWGPQLIFGVVSQRSSSVSATSGKRQSPASSLRV